MTVTSSMQDAWAGKSVRRRTRPAGATSVATSAVSLFSGAGGLDLGLEGAGWRVRAQLEMDHDAVETLRLRNPRGAVIEARIEDVDPRELRRSLGLRRGELGLLAGGPPCQPFTTHGLRQALSDPRASSLFPTYLEFVTEFRPTAVLIENVDGLLSAALRHRPLSRRGPGNAPLRPSERKGSFLRWLLDELVERGYAVTWGVAEAADYGVPQMRQRAILIGVRGKEPCYLPPAMYGWPGLPPYRTLREALAHVTQLGPIQPLSARKRAVYRHIPPGGNWRSLSIAMRRGTMGAAFVAEGGKSGWWRRLAWDEPAPTILGMPDHSSTALIHPDELRCLSVNECAAIQGFPSHMRFAGSPRSQYQQIGNAVPVAVGERIGRHVLDFLGGHRSPVPAMPPWRQASANRRIGTHGWALPRRGGVAYLLNVKVREDHIWTGLGDRPAA